MIIKQVLISEDVKRKIFEKHGVSFEEIENGLLRGNPLVYKTTEGRYLALTHHHRYLTVIFIYESPNAQVITAYPSSPWQIKLYKKKA